MESHERPRVATLLTRGLVHPTSPILANCDAPVPHGQGHTHGARKSHRCHQCNAPAPYGPGPSPPSGLRCSWPPAGQDWGPRGACHPRKRESWSPAATSSATPWLSLSLPVCGSVPTVKDNSEAKTNSQRELEQFLTFKVAVQTKQIQRT